MAVSIETMELTTSVKRFCREEMDKIVKRFYEDVKEERTREQTLALVYGFCRVSKYLDLIEERWFKEVCV